MAARPVVTLKLERCHPAGTPRTTGQAARLVDADAQAVCGQLPNPWREEPAAKDNMRCVGEAELLRESRDHGGRYPK